LISLFFIFAEPLFFKANRYEQTLAKRAEGISQNLHRALQTHNRFANDDITSALIEHARSSLLYERQLLRELEALRGDIDDAAKKVVPAANGVPKPTMIPPLEDFSERPPYLEPTPSAPLSNGFDRLLPSNLQPPHTAGIPSQKGPNPGFIPHKIPNASSNSFYPQSPIPSPQTPTAPDILTRPSSPASTIYPQQALHRHPHSQLPVAGPSSPVIPHSPVPKPTADVPPLGGRLVDGTKSMFIPKRASSPRPSPLAGSASVSSIPGPSMTTSSAASGGPGPTDPLRSTNYNYPAVSSPLRDPLSGQQGSIQSTSPFSRAQVQEDVDPLASVKPRQMASSMRVQPTRPKLDPREAASKLANMF